MLEAKLCVTTLLSCNLFLQFPYCNFWYAGAKAAQSLASGTYLSLPFLNGRRKACSGGPYHYHGQLRNVLSDTHKSPPRGVLHSSQGL